MTASMMPARVVMLAGVGLMTTLEGAELREVSFTAADGAVIYANEYGAGERAVVLAHGMVFDKESWDAQARALAADGFRVLAIDFRGYGKSKGPGGRQSLHEDVLGALRYLRESGATSVSLVGASMGGGAVGRAAAGVRPGEVDRVILLAAVPIEHPERMQGRKLFLATKGDGLYDRVVEQYEKAKEPKRLETLAGEAHAQHIFRTDQGPRLLELMRGWLTER